MDGIDSGINIRPLLAFPVPFHSETALRAASLPDPVVDLKLSTQKGHAKIVIAGGCFWGVQAVYEHVKDVQRATAGYSGGTRDNPASRLISK